MKRKLPVLLLTVCLLFGCMSPVVFADDSADMVVLFEENFDEYEADVDVKSTLMPDFFEVEAQTIGDGFIRVQEDTSGNLNLMSHVFTQIVTKKPVQGAYTFSVDVLESQGKVQAGFYIRAPKNHAAYYEADGDADHSINRSGLLIYPNSNGLGVNVKTYDETQPEKVKNNTYWFAPPSGVSFNSGKYVNLRVEDNGTDEIAIYVADTLICKISFSNPGKSYGKLGISEVCFDNATLFAADGTELASYTDTLVMANGSSIGWATRVANILIDNVKITGSSSNVETEAPTEVPTEMPTEAPTELPTEAPTEVSTETQTDAESSLEHFVGEVTQGETDPTVTPEPQVIDDSLAIWILIAIMLVAVGITAGIVTVKVRK